MARTAAQRVGAIACRRASGGRRRRSARSATAPAGPPPAAARSTSPASRMQSAVGDPAARARSTTSTMSVLNASSARWQCESIGRSGPALSGSEGRRPGGRAGFAHRILDPGGGGGSANVTSSGLPPSAPPASTMPFDSMPIIVARLQVGDDGNRPADDAPRARRPRARPATIVRCFGADVDGQLQQLLRLRHALGGQHLGHAQIDLHEVVDRRCAPSAALRARRGRRGCGAGAGRGGCRRGRRRLSQRAPAKAPASRSGNRS